MEKRYDHIVIGGGAAGLVSAKMAHGLGRRVALIEKRKLGGECTWFGCVPSKALLHAAKTAAAVKHAPTVGLRLDGSYTLSTDGVMNYVRNVIGQIYAHETPEVIAAEGIDVYESGVQFLDATHVKLDDGTILLGKTFALCTGSRPFVPDIVGIESTPYHTNETIFSLEYVPESLVVLGGGPIGIELASAFQMLGSTVTVLQMTERILDREDAELADMLQEKLEQDGLTIETNAEVIAVAPGESGVQVTYRKDGVEQSVTGEALLVAAGRTPNIDGLGLENAGVSVTRKGVVVDAYLRTSAKNIFAFGDCTGLYQFTHAAEYQAITGTRNALFPLFKKKTAYRNMAWCTFTEPELAHVGMTEQEAVQAFGEKNIRVYRHPYSGLDRGVTDNSPTGLVKVITRPNGTVLGAHILGERAGEVIHQVQMLRHFGKKLEKLAGMLYIYPTFADGIKRVAKQRLLDKLLNHPLVKLFRKKH